MWQVTCSLGCQQCGKSSVRIFLHSITCDHIQRACDQKQVFIQIKQCQAASVAAAKYPFLLKKGKEEK